MPPLPTKKKLPLLTTMNLEHPLCPLCCHSCFRHGSTHSGKEESKIISNGASVCFFMTEQLQD